MKPKTVVIRAAALLTALFLAAAVLFQAGNETGEDYIVKVKDSGVPFLVVSRGEMLRLRRAGRLEWYEPDGTVTLLEEGAAGYYTEDKWDLAMIGAEAAFERGLLGQGVRVGILDSGVNPHEELADHLLPGHNCMDGGEKDDTADNYGHGTQIAGLVAGTGENGYTGAAPGAELVPIKITEGKAVAVSTVCRAIYTAIDDYGCRVLNLSLGITTDHRSLREAIDYAEEKGVVVVAAAGNKGKSGLNYPAAYETVIGVGSVDRDGIRYYHSNHNESVFLTAPGVNVKTTGFQGGYVTATGTSFAVSYVTAAAAVLLGADAALTPADIRAILAGTALDRGAAGWDEEYGWGILSIAGCVTALEEREAPPCVFTSASTVRNDTDRDIDCTYLLAEYDESGRCVNVRTWRFTLPALSTAEILPPEENRICCQLLCETETMIPLAKARRAP